MADTGYPLKDALTSIRNQLWNKRADWEITQIYEYPEYLIGGTLNTISLEVLSTSSLTQEEFGGPDTMFSYNIDIRITYVAPQMTLPEGYAQCLMMIDNIWKYLLQNPEPDSFGTIKAVEGVDIGTMPDEADTSHTFMAQIDITLTVYKPITES